MEKEIHFSPGAFISSLLFNLNVDNICKKEVNINIDTIEELNEILLPKMNERTEKLENISSEKALQRQFPMLYDKYINYQNFYNTAKKVHSFLEDENISTKNKFAFLSNMKKR